MVVRLSHKDKLWPSKERAKREEERKRGREEVICLPAKITSTFNFNSISFMSFRSSAPPRSSIVSTMLPPVSNYNPLQPINTTDFKPAPYIVASVVERYHNTWRFGHSNNFTQFVNGVLIDGDASDATDYVAG